MVPTSSSVQSLYELSLTVAWGQARNSAWFVCKSRACLATTSYCIIYKTQTALCFLNTTHSSLNTSLNWVLSYALWLCMEIYCFKVKGVELLSWRLFVHFHDPPTHFTLRAMWIAWVGQEQSKAVKCWLTRLPLLSAGSELWSLSTIDTRQWSRTADVPAGLHTETWTSPLHSQIGARVQGRKYKAGIFILNEGCFGSGSYSVPYSNFNLTLNIAPNFKRWNPIVYWKSRSQLCDWT